MAGFYVLTLAGLVRAGLLADAGAAYFALLVLAALHLGRQLATLDMTRTTESLGRVLRPRGVRRQTLSLRPGDRRALEADADADAEADAEAEAEADADAEAHAVRVEALLCRGTLPLAHVREIFYARPVARDVASRAVTPC